MGCLSVCLVVGGWVGGGGVNKINKKKHQLHVVGDQQNVQL